MNSHYYGNRGTTSSNKFLVKDGPIDTVSQIVWNTHINNYEFLCCGWDGCIRYYYVQKTSTSLNIQKLWQLSFPHPIISCDIHPQNIAFAGIANGDVVCINMRDNQFVVLGKHNAPICGVFWVKQKGFLISLGLDQSVKFWNIAPNNNRNFQIHQIQLPLKTHACSYDYPFLMIASCDSTLLFINLHSQPNSTKVQKQDYLDTDLKKFSKITSCRILYGNNPKYIACTIDGRYSYGSVNQDRSSGKIKITSLFVARTQKKQETRGNTYGQVNAVDIGSFNYQNFPIAGGTIETKCYNVNIRSPIINIINYNSKEHQCVTALRISPDSQLIVYATGNDWSKGLYEFQIIKKPEIYVMKPTQYQLKQVVKRS